MVKPTNTAAIAQATGRAWDKWFSQLEDTGARTMNHTEIAQKALELMPDATDNKEWWAQGVAVAFEQQAGLRKPGQSSDGDFKFSVSKTFAGDKDAALQAWLDEFGDRTEFNGVEIEGSASTSSTDKWRYWRIKLVDGTRVSVTIGDKPQGKSSLAVEHSKLDSAEAIEYWRPLWKELLAQL